MTKLLQRLHDELVRRHYATTTRESYLRIRRFTDEVAVDSTELAPTRSGVTKSICSKNGSWRSGLSLPRSPRSGSSSCAC